MFSILNGYFEGIGIFQTQPYCIILPYLKHHLWCMVKSWSRSRWNPRFRMSRAVCWPALDAAAQPPFLGSQKWGWVQSSLCGKLAGKKGETWWPILSCIFIHDIQYTLPIVPRKAVAEVSEIGKPIGEVGCCESRMAERIHWWTDRWLRSPLFLSFFLSFSDSLPTYLPPTYLPTYSLSLCVCLSVCLLIYLSTYLSIYLPIYLSTYLSTYLSIYLSIYLAIYLSSYLSIYPSSYLSNLI